MQANSQGGQQDILHTIDLTAKLEQSLRRLLTKKKSTEPSHFSVSQQHHQKQQSQLLSKIQALQQQNRELYVDNQKLSREIIQVKEDLHNCKKQLQSSKKYLHFLQSYNDDLKKELLYWMKGGNQKTNRNEPRLGQLIKKIIDLRKENQQKQYKLMDLSKTISIDNEPYFPPEQPRYKRSLNVDLSKYQTQSLGNKKVKNININDCSSCNYKSKSKTKGKKKFNTETNVGSKSKVKLNKSKNLRKWHNNYLSKCEYIH